MKTLVMKFGGASVRTPESFSKIAEIIIERTKIYEQLAIVVSAMGDTTDYLIDLAQKVHPSAPKREYDMLVSVGERISISLLAMALDLKGKQAVSFTGSQSGIITCANHGEASIINVKPQRILNSFKEGKLAIIAGFQGVSQKGEITTLGRGGSDTTAVALGIALKAEKVEFFKDVAGIFDKNPKKDESAQIIKQLDYTTALEVVSRTGGQVLHPRCIKLAQKNFLQLHILSFEENPLNEYLSSSGTFISEPLSRQKSEEVYYEV